MTHLLTLFLTLSLPSLFSAQIYNQLAVYTTDNTVGLLDFLTGTLTCPTAVPLPTPSPGCHWTSLTGARGQTSASFKQNSTYFFTSQQICTNGTSSSVYLWQAYGPYSCQNGPQLYLITVLDTQAPIEQLNLGWDHTCNIVVLIPKDGSVLTRQVSEYDGQNRPRPDYSTGAQDCWQRVPGTAALDFGNAQPSWPSGEELNCGDSCVMYTLEECTSNGKGVLPRRLHGKYFRTGTEASKTIDSVQIQSFSFVPMYWSSTQQFLGVGVCCEESWCHPGCKGLDGHNVLVSFLPGQLSFEVLDDLGVEDAATGKVGVEFSAMYPDSRYVMVYHGGEVITYTPLFNGGYIVAVKRISSFSLEKNIVAWFGYGY